MFSSIKSHVTEIINKNTVFINFRVRYSFLALSEITPLKSPGCRRIWFPYPPEIALRSENLKQNSIHHQTLQASIRSRNRIIRSINPSSAAQAEQRYSIGKYDKAVQLRHESRKSKSMHLSNRPTRTATHLQVEETVCGYPCPDVHLQLLVIRA